MTAVNDTTERQRINRPRDPPTLAGRDVTPPVELDSYRALDLYACIGNEPWELRGYVKNVTNEALVLTDSCETAR